LSYGDKGGRTSVSGFAHNNLIKVEDSRRIVSPAETISS